MIDKPDKISFIRRRVWMEQFEIIPRRRNDKRLFDKLTQRQEDAYNRIEEAHGYEMAGLPIARMRYTDAPPGFDFELTPSQLQVVVDYRAWNVAMKPHGKAHFAVLGYMTGDTLRGLERRLRLRNGQAVEAIAFGLQEYCKLKKWVDHETRRRKPIRIKPPVNDKNSFIANYFDDLGRPVRDFKIPDLTDGDISE